MKCDSCGGAMKTSRRNYRYKESGLSNVVLENVELRRCPRCGEEELVLPRIAELHRVLAKAIAEKLESLSGDEIRYLRKYLGWSGEDFSKYFGVTRETVSRWETCARRMSVTAERLLRLYTLALEPIKDYSILQTVGQGSPVEARYRLALEDHWQLKVA